MDSSTIPIGTTLYVGGMKIVGSRKPSKVERKKKTPVPKENPPQEPQPEEG